MHVGLIIIGLLSWVFAYLIGVRKNLYFLREFSYRKVKDTNKLARIGGFYLAFIGTIMLILGFTSDEHSNAILLTALIMIVAVYIVIQIYVRLRMIER